MPLSATMENEARPSSHLNINLGEHWGIVAPTGGGKTVFTCRGLLVYMQRMFPHVPRYLLDSTADPDMPRLLPDAIFVEGNHMPDLLKSPEKTLVWTPRNSKLPAEYARWFDNFIDSRTPAIIVLDEIASITRQALESMEALFKQLRKHGGTVAAETQRIAKVDTDIFSQLSHFIVFTVIDPYDTQQARNYLNIPKEEYVPPSNKYGFHYRRTRGGQYAAKEYADMHDFFGESIY